VFDFSAALLKEELLKQRAETLQRVLFLLLESLQAGQSEKEVALADKQNILDE